MSREKCYRGRQEGKDNEKENGERPANLPEPEAIR